MRTKLVNISDIQDAIHMHGPIGAAIGSLAIRILGFKRLNEYYANIHQYEGREFCEKVMEAMNIQHDVLAEDLENIPKTGPFILVSNHPFGAIDGILMFRMIAAVRPDFKILTNFLLSHIENLKDHFLPVNPFSELKGKKKSLPGIRAAKELLANGGGLGLFPAGEVATYYNRPMIEDKVWSSSMIKLIRTSEVPVIPVYFDGYNSKTFYRLGRIHPLLRTARLPRELVNKSGKTITMRIGKPIPVNEVAEFKQDRELERYLRSRVYALEAQAATFVEKHEVLPDNLVPVAEPKPKELILEEIKALEANNFLFNTGSYRCYLSSSENIPNLMHELGRLREEAFRKAGEGTNTALDLDDFDKTYQHLLLWDEDKQQLVGAYRLGVGEDIYHASGINGFYSNTLFRYSPKIAAEVLPQAIELGRSFVANEYQREALPLMLLIKGLMLSVVKYPNCRYLIGPVSISNWYPDFYKSMMVHYITENHQAAEFKGEITATSPFAIDTKRCELDALLSKKSDTVEKFDRFMLRLSNNTYRLPTLVKKYIKLNCRFLAFNVDKDFNNCLDGLILMDLKDTPREEIENLAKDRDDRTEILARFGFEA
ncbi:MAG: lysophospholipid acyltransferase family protein [Bacteroidales bacterium]|nr:lysophospholipid acyltransferase family protein [Bacteroidales bacterium]